MRTLIALVFLLLTGQVLAQESCDSCHAKVTPLIVEDWKNSRHFDNEIGCDMCHEGEHSSAEDVGNLSTITAETCGACHGERLEQFSKGKHALSWASVNAMPTTHALPMALNQGMKGCTGCHKLGLKSDEEIAALKQAGSQFGHASCDACHTRHTFSVKEAREPQACQTCHMGFDHPQWEMWSSSKHGVRYLLKQNGTLPESTPAPTCQTCHMVDGDHEVRTAWGFLAVRLPLSDDPQWKADQVTILQALGVLDSKGEPTPRLEVIKAADVARLTKEDFDRERNKMLKVCGDCHSANFAKAELDKADALIRDLDHLLAEGIREIAALYQEGVLTKPESYAEAFPDLLTFHDAPTSIEQTLFEMHLKHRMRGFQGAFHANPDYALWYGWSEMVRDLQEIKEKAEEMRRSHSQAKAH
ncbi:Seven times multi-haem cytochrome CxxCH [Ferrimonas sediminum]|uniref:Seven times multi-haem cytochrome CxxCH n=1 Tax=Ferrimonas sediminum TaxID=718193 RepID=A0A1G8SC19_9GAMM|nr:multiheme c-type cytochrome [Ferrimonas sediminum]SDJ26776.1 Seven times multi-haem cytochrome CxxCH [Ferrimonas sediminum]